MVNFVYREQPRLHLLKLSESIIFQFRNVGTDDHRAIEASQQLGEKTPHGRHRRHLHRYDRAQGCLETGFERVIAEEFLDDHALPGAAHTMNEDILHANPGG
jgi:hypothetical protein